MSVKTPQPQPDDEVPRPGESFLDRFHRRKTEARLAETETDVLTTDTGHESIAVAETGTAPAEELTDADMPPLDSLGAGSDYTGFLSPRVSETLRRAALRKLFHGAEFNVIDPLDDYAEDFTTFTALGDIVTADMRHLLEVEARKQAEALKQSILEGGDGSPPQTAGADVPEHSETEQTTSASQIQTDGEEAVPLLPEKTQ
ncbi:MAG: DUF3306 domain-containing protein [Sedimenticolaceae bacterium]